MLNNVKINVVVIEINLVDAFLKLQKYTDNIKTMSSVKWGSFSDLFLVCISSVKELVFSCAGVQLSGLTLFLIAKQGSHPFLLHFYISQHLKASSEENILDGIQRTDQIKVSLYGIWVMTHISQ